MIEEKKKIKEEIKLNAEKAWEMKQRILNGFHSCNILRYNELSERKNNLYTLFKKTLRKNLCHYLIWWIYAMISSLQKQVPMNSHKTK